MRLNARQRKFAHEYVKNGFVGVQAVLAAGYRFNYNAACVEASRLLRKPKVQNLVEEHIKRAKLSADEVLEELSDIAKTPTQIDGNQKLKALELLGKGHKLFVDRTETTDTTERDSSALSKSILTAAKLDHISPESAAVALFHALQDDPAHQDINSWPAEYRSAIQASLSQNTEQIQEIGDQ